MRSTIDQLSPAEKKALALWYDTASYKALLHLAELEVQGLAADALIAPNMEQVRYLHGRSSWAADIFKLVKELYKQSNKES